MLCVWKMYATFSIKRDLHKNLATLKLTYSSALTSHCGVGHEAQPHTAPFGTVKELYSTCMCVENMQC